MNRCNYLFPNQTKSHNKNDVCNSVIRKKNHNGKCWRHQKEENNKNIDLKSSSSSSSSEDTNHKCNYIQLENS